jgi:hypothetical protein
VARLWAARASAFGSLWVSRRGVIREARLTLYDDILPEMLDQLEHGSAIALRLLLQRRDLANYGERERPRLEELISALQRVAHLAGRRERHFVQRFVDETAALKAVEGNIADELQAYRNEHGSSATGFVASDVSTAEKERAEAARVAVLHDLDAYLKRKIHSGLLRAERLGEPGRGEVDHLVVGVLIDALGERHRRVPEHP